MKQIRWRKPTNDELLKVEPIRRKDLIGSLLLMFICIPVIILVMFKLLPSWIGYWWIVLIPVVLVVAFIIMRIHLHPKIEVAEVEVISVSRIISTEINAAYSTIVAQDGVEVEDFSICDNELREVGSKALLVTLNRDPYSTYLV